ncbi:MAG: hypothetical protein LBU12_06675 [Deltaproteobacteria bacterium]|jgi:hypothetical protein|nr:hypothetical protein [Deltaproteobacteria bacterium]
MAANNLSNSISSSNDNMSINSETVKFAVSSMSVIDNSNHINNNKIFFINLINNIDKRLTIVERSISELKDSIFELKDSIWQSYILIIISTVILFTISVFIIQQNAMEKRLDDGTQAMEKRLDDGTQAMEKRLDDGTQAMEKRLDDAFKIIDDKLDIILKDGEITRKLAIEAMNNSLILSNRDLYSKNNDKF